MAHVLPREVDVVIVGGGPAGLAAAIELGIRNISVLLVEQNPRGGVAPRAKTTNVRTRTHLRRWGIARDLADEAPFGVDYPNNMVFVTRLGPGGHELTRFSNAFNAAPEHSDLYPEHGQWIPQYKLEKVLLQKARTLASVDIRFGVKFVTATQDDARVYASLDQPGESVTVPCQYLIGADGGRSGVRSLIGARMEGRAGLSRAYNIIFRAPGLREAHSFGPAAIYWQVGRDGRSTIGPMDQDDVWFFMPGVPGDKILTDEEAAGLIRLRTGIDLPYEILSADAWFANDLLADRYADRRIVLIGDACHLHPPLGGYGMNMGIGDGVDVGWKIAATLQGWGGPNLVASYEAERRRVHRLVIDETMAIYADSVAEVPSEIEDESPAGAAARQAVGETIRRTRGREFATLGMVLGLGYEGSPIICPEEGPAPSCETHIYRPTARPGYLAPHAWLADGRSLYDLFGLDFTLLAAESADSSEIERAEREAAELGIPLTVLHPPGLDVAALYEAKLVLVRPDQHVAWRGDHWESPFSTVTGGAMADAPRASALDA